jgi:tetratricopeptide (TPR) repeat protein
MEGDWWGLVSESYWGELVDAGLYRPLTLLSFGLNHAVSAGPSGFHLVNDGLHALAAVLVLFVAQSLGGSRFFALAAGLLFAVHPALSEAVNGIVGRAEILAFLFVGASFLLYLREKNGFVVGALFFLGLCSKESAAFGVALFAAHALLFHRWRRLLPLGSAIAAYALLRISVLGGLGIGGREIGFLDNPAAMASMGTRLVTAVVLLWKYVGLVLWPDVLSADYSFDQIPLPSSFPDVRVLAGVAVAAAAVVLAWKRKDRLLRMSLGAFFLPLLGFLHVLFPLGTLFAERLLYFPMLGGVLLLAYGLSRLPGRLGPALLSILVVAGAARTMDRNQDWLDNETLFRRTVETSPQSARSYFLLGAELMEQRRFAEAAPWFEKGLQIYPDHVGARMSMGEALMASDQPVEAEAAFREALTRAPGDDEIRRTTAAAAVRAGIETARRGDPEGARVYFERAIEIDPDSAEAWSYLGVVAEHQGRLDEARERYEEALHIDPSYVPALVNLGSVEMSAGRLPEAEALFRQAIDLAPDTYEAYNGLGIALARQGHVEEAESAFREALRIDPALDAARDNLRALGKTP